MEIFTNVANTDARITIFIIILDIYNIIQYYTNKYLICYNKILLPVEIWIEVYMFIQCNFAALWDITFLPL